MILSKIVVGLYYIIALVECSLDIVLAVVLLESQSVIPNQVLLDKLYHTI